MFQDALKGWFSQIRKPQQRASSQPTERKAAVEPTLGQVRRPAKGVSDAQPPNPIFAIRKTGRIVPAKRAAAPDEQPIDVSRKVPRVQQEHSAAVDEVDGRNAGSYSEEDVVRNYSKRSRASSSENEHARKKTKTNSADLSHTIQSDGLNGLRKGVDETSPYRESELDADTVVYGLHEVENTPSRDLYSEGDAVSYEQTHEPGNLLQALKERPATAIRNQARTYVQSTAVPRDMTLSRSSSVRGIGSWSGSHDIPGSRKPVANDVDEVDFVASKGRRKTRTDATCSNVSRHQINDMPAGASTATELTTSKVKNGRSTTFRQHQLPKTKPALNKVQRRLHKSSKQRIEVDVEADG